MLKELLGEGLGTFILVFIGCGSVALDVLFGTFGHIIPIALVWGGGVALAIFASRKLCPAHLNPAVSLAMWISGNLSFKKVLPYWLAQFLGAFLAAGLLYIIFNSSIQAFEVEKSVSTAKMFGEFYSTSTLTAFILELVGTVFLVLMIYLIVSKIKNNTLVPILIGLVVSTAIVVIAPYTQCGINPARDLAPRLFSYITGWESIAFSQSSISVYVLAPLVGGLFSAFVYNIIKKASNF